ncbi:M1 family metallopeptidase [Streptomyces sp. NPDC057854]|uniref:M1 family metallopeptidase n=2 Tax=unclassified Streptomyces TaxID=2593676 RepID=UPI0036B12FC8
MTYVTRGTRVLRTGRTGRSPRAAARTAAALVVLGLLAGGCVPAAGGGVRGTPGAAGLKDPYYPRLGNGGYDVSRYALDLAYDPDGGHLDGTARITARATQDLSALNLDLSGLTVAGATVDGEPAAVNRAGHELTLRPRDELREGAEFTVTVDYAGVPEPVTDPDGSTEGWLRTPDGAVAVGQPAGSMSWFPGNHHPSDKASYEIALTAPSRLTALSNGVRVSSGPVSGGRTRTVWRQTEPMASYLATVMIGRYETGTATALGDVPVITAAEPSLASATAALRAEIPRILARQQDRFGPYPFSAAGAVVTRDGLLGYALETQTRPVFPASSFDRTTLVHELAHQWYGNSVTPESWRDIWLNEGFATYAEWLYAEEHGSVPARESFASAFADDDNWTFPPADPPAAENLFDPPVYRRGAMVLHKVRETVGDRVFGELLRGWAAKYRHANASTEDFTAYAESVAGRDLDAVWKVWLYGDGRPERP